MELTPRGPDGPRRGAVEKYAQGKLDSLTAQRSEALAAAHERVQEDDFDDELAEANWRWSEERGGYTMRLPTPAVDPTGAPGRPDPSRNQSPGRAVLSGAVVATEWSIFFVLGDDVVGSS